MSTTLILILAGITPAVRDGSPDPVVAAAVHQLVALQEEGGAWPYEGVYRVAGHIPIGYRVGGTALVCQALVHAAPANDPSVDKALERGLDCILAGLDDPQMQPSRADAYDVRVWGQACALEFLCHLRQSGRLSAGATALDERITALVGTLVFEQLEDGGWNYATRRRHASFVTAPVLQALLWARALGVTVPDDVLTRGRAALEASRVESGAFFYSGRATRPLDDRARVPGAIARAPLCETTLRLLGGSSESDIERSIGQFFDHWGELEKRRRQTGTHVPPYGIAPYYFYFGHRYAGQAIEALPADRRATWRTRLRQTLLRTRDADGTWNDRVFERSRNFGTAMALMVLLAPEVPLPPGVDLLAPANGG